MSVGPVIRDQATAEFFDGVAAGLFLLRQCPAGHVSEPTAAVCTTCGATELQWVPAAGGATLVSWAVSHGRAAGGEPAPKTVLVIAAFDEGPWWWAQLADASAGDGLEVGQRLRVEFRRADGAETENEPVPVFVRA
jgi:uncharacterized OB-fold protein